MGVGPVRDDAGIRAEGDRHVVGEGDFCGVPHRRRGGECFLGAESLQHAVLGESLDGFAGHHRRDEKRSALSHHLRAFFIEKRAVLDRRHSGANGDLDALCAVRVGGDFSSELRRLIDQSFHLLVGVLRGADRIAFREYTAGGAGLHDIGA